MLLRQEASSVVHGGAFPSESFELPGGYPTPSSALVFGTGHSRRRRPGDGAYARCGAGAGSRSRPWRRASDAAGVGCSALLDRWPEWYIPLVTFTIEIERESDDRWIAEVPELSGVMAYGQDRDEAVARVQALALRVIADRLEHREAPTEFLNVAFQAA